MKQWIKFAIGHGKPCLMRICLWKIDSKLDYRNPYKKPYEFINFIRGIILKTNILKMYYIFTVYKLDIWIRLNDLHRRIII